MKSLTITAESLSNLIPLTESLFKDLPIIGISSESDFHLLGDAASLLKKHFDKMILFTGSAPSAHEADTIFGLGFHGVLFPADAIDWPAAEHAVQLFGKGFVFAELTEWSNETASDLERRGVVPFTQNPSERETAKGALAFQGRLISFPETVRITDRVRLKLLLEVSNLRQKLMVSEVNQSFESSSL